MSILVLELVKRKKIIQAKLAKSQYGIVNRESSILMPQYVNPKRKHKTYQHLLDASITNFRIWSYIGLLI